MATVQAFCDRAMLIHDGELRYLGDPEEAVLRYYRLNFGGSEGENGASQGGAVPDVNVKLVDVWLENEAGERVENIEQGEPIGFNLVVEARHELTAPGFGFQVLNVDDVPVFGFGKELFDDEREPDRVAAGQQVRISARIENPLVPGRYSVECSISRNHTPGDVVVRDLRLLDFLVRGAEPFPGMVFVQTDFDAILER
jgi:hypothetical protein